MGKWYLTIWNTKNKLIEVGIGKPFVQTDNYGAFMAKTRSFLFFWVTITKPTLAYILKSLEEKEGE